MRRNILLLFGNEQPRVPESQLAGERTRFTGDTVVALLLKVNTNAQNIKSFSEEQLESPVCNKINM